jgi:hypothetical protein
MREIKFEYMFRYEDNGYHYDKHIFTLDEIRKGAVDEWLGYSFVSSAEVVVIRQFTGLKDKNGKEIYEGDVVFWASRNFIVEWDKDKFIMKTLKEGFGSIDRWEECEVIGNIYENPELLK